MNSTNICFVLTNILYGSVLNADSMILSKVSFGFLILTKRKILF